MNILFLNGSPRRGGMNAQYLQAMARTAVEMGAKVEFLHIGAMKIKYCTGCEVCRTRRSCVLPPDDSVLFLEKLRWADVFVVGSPCYLYNMSAQLKTLFDRIVYGLMKEREVGLPQPLMRGKNAFVVITSTAPWPFNRLLGYSSGTYGALKRILHMGGFRMLGSIQRGNTKKHPAFMPADARLAGKRMKGIIARCRRSCKD